MGEKLSLARQNPRQNTPETTRNEPPTARNQGGRPCETCRNPRAAEINRRLAAGEPTAFVARAYGINVNALARHRDKHLTDADWQAARTAADEAAARAEAADAMRQAEAENALQRARPAPVRSATDADPIEESDKLRSFTYGLMAKAFQTRDYSLTLRCAAEIRAQLEQSAKLKGKLEDAAGAVVVIDTTALAAKLQERLARLAPPPRTIDVDGEA